MKKWLIGSFVGAVLIFVWQFLSWTVFQLHEAEARYIPAQDSVLSYLSTQFKETGTYMLPTVPPGSSQEKAEELGKTMEGKPWVTLTYRTSYAFNMTRPMIRGFLVGFVLVFCLIYIVTRGGKPAGVNIFAASIALGLITFLWGPYTEHVWFQTPVADLKGPLIDALVAWGLPGSGSAGG